MKDQKHQKQIRWAVVLRRSFCGQKEAKGSVRYSLAWGNKETIQTTTVPQMVLFFWPFFGLSLCEVVETGRSYVAGQLIRTASAEIVGDA